MQIEREHISRPRSLVRRLKVLLEARFERLSDPQLVAVSCGRAGRNRKRNLDQTIISPAALNRWRVRQSQRFRHLREDFPKRFDGNILLGSAVLDKVKIGTGPLSAATIEFSKLDSLPEHALVLVNNNDVYRCGMTKYINLYLESEKCLFVVWDFDNHHALNNSYLLAAFSDFYVPCHNENLAELAAITDSIGSPVSAGIIQWSREFLASSLDRIKTAKRSETPLGRHIVYPQFKTRLEKLKRLNRHFPDVGPATAQYHQRTSAERLDEWCSHMAHWVLPVRNDLPIRIFDALVTGGIPIVPRSLKFHESLRKVRDHILFFDDEDVESPLAITETANTRFKQAGVAGILERHHLAMEHCHVDARIAEILSTVSGEFGLTRSATATGTI